MLAHLDLDNTLAIINILSDINSRGTTIIFATHDQSLFDLIPQSKVFDLTH